MKDSGVFWSTEKGVQPAAQVDVKGRQYSTSKTPSQPGRFELFEYGWKTSRTFLPPALGVAKEQAGNSPLTGLRVLDLANVIAGPSAGRTLAHLGAEVIHVSAVNPVMGPRMNLLLGAEVNQGKRSIALDLHTPAGQEVLHRMLSSMDVLLYNKLPEQAERMGVAPEQVHTLNPNTVVTAVTAYSGVEHGGWEGRASYDPVIQAVSGIMQRFGGQRTPQVHGIASCIDYFTGFSGAFATLVALMARLRGDQHLVARTSLIRTAGWVQLNQLANLETARTQACGMDCLGNGEDEFLVQCRNGWVVVTQYPGRNLSLTEAALRETMRALTVKEAIIWAASKEFLASPVLRASDLRKSASTTDKMTATDANSGVIHSVNHSAGITIFLPRAAWLRWNNSFLPALNEAPLPGQDTLEILRQFGYDEFRSQELLNGGEITTGWKGLNQYVPN
jgi:crotonobetainyl-CoA:carnitine CoA-transferase CaiB-like acyl-CoA transferase